MEVDVHPDGLQFAHGLQRRDGVPGEAGHRLGDDHVDLSGPAISQKPLEFLAVILGARHGLVGIDTRITPARMLLDEVAVVADLRCQRMQHGILSG